MRPGPGAPREAGRGPHPLAGAFLLLLSLGFSRETLFPQSPRFCNPHCWACCSRERPQALLTAWTPRPVFSRYQDPDIDVQLSSELSDSLRTLKVLVRLECWRGDACAQ